MRKFSRWNLEKNNSFKVVSIGIYVYFFHSGHFKALISSHFQWEGSINLAQSDTSAITSYWHPWSISWSAKLYNKNNRAYGKRRVGWCLKLVELWNFGTNKTSNSPKKSISTVNCLLASEVRITISFSLNIRVLLLFGYCLSLKTFASKRDQGHQN